MIDLFERAAWLEAHSKPGPELEAALLAAQVAVEAVGKDSKNQHHGYKYASADAVVAASRPALHGAGLIAEPWAVGVVPAAPPWPASIETIWRVAHAASGQHRLYLSTMPVIPERGRPEDKALAAARTLDSGLFLRNLLQLEREDENAPDPSGRDDTRHRSEIKRQAPTPRQARAASPPTAPETAAAPAAQEPPTQPKPAYDAIAGTWALAAELKFTHAQVRLLAKRKYGRGVEELTPEELGALRPVLQTEYERLHPEARAAREEKTREEIARDMADPAWAAQASREG